LIAVMLSEAKHLWLFARSEMIRDSSLRSE